MLVLISVSIFIVLVIVLVILAWLAINMGIDDEIVTIFGTIANAIDEKDIFIFGFFLAYLYVQGVAEKRAALLRKFDDRPPPNLSLGLDLRLLAKSLDSKLGFSQKSEIWNLNRAIATLEQPNSGNELVQGRKPFLPTTNLRR